MPTFLVVGEGQYAIKVAKAIDAPRIEPTKIDSVGPTQRLADWLLSVNNDRILRPSFLELFGGRLNFHNGKLPEYAGRHVHQWAIRNGETESEATIHHIDVGVDSGDIVATRAFPIRPTDTGLSLFQTSFRIGSDLMIEVARAIQRGESLPRRPQVGTRHVYRHKDALDGEIDFASLTARQVVDFVRAGNYDPFRSPSYTPTWSGVRVRKAEVVESSGPNVVACRNGFVRLAT